MESAKKKEILNSFLEASKEWRYWKEETERLMVAATGASPSLSGMPHGGSTSTSKVEIAAESLEDARRELAAAAAAIMDLADEMRTGGQQDLADKFTGALAAALRALADQAEGGAE